MKVVDTRVLPMGGHIPTAQNAQRRWDERRGFLLELVDDQGRVGQGEASPLPGYSDEAPDEVFAALGTLCPGAYIESLADVAAVIAAMDGAIPSARFATETALLDLLARHLGKSIEQCLAPDRLLRNVPLAAVVTDDRSARLALEAGAASLKIKIGRDLEDELAFVARLRGTFGPAFGLRIDANQSLPLATAPRWLERFGAFHPEFVEEPVAPGDLASLEASAVKIALDESLARPDAQDRVALLAERGLLGAFVLKPARLGGVLACLEWAAQGAAVGIPSVASHMLGGPIELRACVALALVLGPSTAHGLWPHAGLIAWPDTRIASFRSGRLHAEDAPGLGFSRISLRP
jgi:o-succinylbenzoate synthase